MPFSIIALLRVTDCGGLRCVQTKRAPVIVSVIDELSQARLSLRRSCGVRVYAIVSFLVCRAAVQRAGLRIALSNRDEQTLEPVLSFLVHALNPQLIFVRLPELALLGVCCAGEADFESALLGSAHRRRQHPAR